MGPTIAATIYGAAAVIAAYFFRPRVSEAPAIARAALFWLVSTPVLFLIASPLGALAASGVLLAALSPSKLDDRAAYYLMTIVAVPTAVAAHVPFPGLNYLIILDFVKVASFAILLPILVFAPPPAAARHAPTPGLLILLLTLLLCGLEFRGGNLTNGLRESLDDIIVFAMPFMAILRFTAARPAFDKIFASIVFLGVLFFFSAAISQATRWNFYTFLIERHGERIFADFRGGILRVSVTLIPILVGYVMTLAYLAVEYFRASRKSGAMTAWLYRGMFAVTAFFTYSRGAWLAMIAGLGAYYFFTKAPRSLRPAALGAALFIGLPATISYVMTADFSSIDAYGTFAYRRDLLLASLEQIGAHPLFGDRNFLESESLSHLYTGMGLIDIVNYYLKIALEQGLIALGLYLSAFAVVIAGLLGLGKRASEFQDGGVFEQQRAVLLGAVMSYLIMAATISDVSLVQHFGVVILALATTFLAAARAELRGAAAEKTGDLHE
ncbi:MAG: O-antigen ligase family protein [Amphiplicatus sp.]